MSGIERNAIKKMAVLDETPLIVRLARSEVYPDPDQPRKSRSQEKLEGLAQTMLIKQLQPCLVRQVDGRDGYMIIVGEGRWLAAGINEEKLGTEQYLDCILVDETNLGKILAMQLVENLQREDMNALHVANGYQRLLDMGFCKTGKELSDMTGVSPATISVYLKVANGPDEIRALVESGATKIDSARTLMKLAELNPQRADELIQAAKENGNLSRDTVREAYEQEQARAEHAAAAAEAAHEATQLQAGGDSSVNVQPYPATMQGRSEPEHMPEAGTHVGPEVQAGVTLDIVQEPPQMAAGDVQRVAEGAGKADVEKTSETAPKAPVQPVVETAKPAAASSPAPAASPVSTAPTQQQSTDAAPQAPADSPLVVAEKLDVLVSIRSGTPDEERFITLEVEYGNARLASHIVHREASRAWVQFGSGPEHEQLQAFNCSDLEIVKVVQRA